MTFWLDRVSKKILTEEQTRRECAKVTFNYACKVCSKPDQYSFYIRIYNFDPPSTQKQWEASALKEMSWINKRIYEGITCDTCDAKRMLKKK